MRSADGVSNTNAKPEETAMLGKSAAECGEARSTEILNQAYDVRLRLGSCGYEAIFLCLEFSLGWHVHHRGGVICWRQGKCEAEGFLAFLSRSGV